MAGSDSGRHPSAGRAWYKAHGLGNDYLVFEEGSDWRLDPHTLSAVCRRRTGVGADGIVLLLADRGDGVRHLRMFNPDGSEFERSGNGLRVLASYLARAGAVDTQPFTVEVGGNHVAMTVHSSRHGRHDVSVAMGRARVGPDAVALDPRALDPRGRLGGPDASPLDVTPVSVGNPHLVVLGEPLTDDALESLGPFLATHPALAAGANVQLAAVPAPDQVELLIWERGVGRTTASGTSSCAAAVAAVHRGLLEPGWVRVGMEGGELSVRVASDLDVTLRGPVDEVAEGRLTEGFLEALEGV